jgi:hypothetical protein
MQTNPPDPAAGGRYTRNADGSLTLVHQTEQGTFSSRKKQREKADQTEAKREPPMILGYAGLEIEMPSATRESRKEK